MSRTSHRLLALLATLLLVLPLAACEQNGGPEPSITTDEAEDDVVDPADGPEPEPSPETGDGSTTNVDED